MVYKPIQERLILNMKKKLNSCRDMQSGSHKALQQCIKACHPSQKLHSCAIAVQSLLMAVRQYK